MTWISIVLPFLWIAGVLLLATVASGMLHRRCPLVISIAITLIGCLAGPIVLFEGLLLGLVSLDYYFRNRSWRTFAIASFVVCLFPVGFSWMVHAPELALIDQLRVEYPMESVAARLDYERTSPAVWQREAGTAASQAPQTALRTSPEVETALRKFEDERQGQSLGRAYHLQRVHDEAYKQFVVTDGFGAMRMIPFRPEYVRLPAVPPVPMICQTEPEESRGESASPAGPSLLDRNILEPLHRSAAVDFLALDRMGYVQDRDHVVGFIPHALKAAPQSRTAVEDWEITHLELVSLLKFETPRVYESEHLPNMQELSSNIIPTRELHPFEAAALPQLVTERELVIDDSQDPGRIRMLGALRAGTDCLQCHSARRGELLGAFSYQLVNRRPAP